MAKEKRYKSTLARAEKIRQITLQHYEPGNQARSYRVVWLKWIYPDLKISFRTYQRYLGIPIETPAANLTPSLFDLD